jgi:hypothetical protein
MGGVKALGPAITSGAAVGAGAVAAAFANAGIKKILPASIPPWASGVGIALAGVLLPKFVKSQVAVDAGKGMVAAGVLFAVNESFLSLPGISGMGATPEYRYTPKLQRSVGAPGFMDKPIAGVRDLHAIGALYDN